MPTQGSIGDQPALLVQAFDQITFAKSVLDDEDRNKEDKGNDNGPSGNGGGWVNVKNKGN